MNKQTQAPLAVGYYQPGERFRAIPEHVCVLREDHPVGGTPVAVCGPSGDPASEADARLFAAAPDLLDAVHGVETLYAEMQAAMPALVGTPAFKAVTDAVDKARAAIARATGGVA